MIHVLTVDSSVARLYEVTGSRPALREIVDFGNAVAGLHERDLVSARPGRSYNRSAGVHQAYEPAMTEKRLATQRWLRDVGKLLGSLLADRPSHGLILVASPRLLAEFKPCLPRGLRSKVVGEHARNLSGLPISVLGARLATVIATAQRRLAEPRIRQAVARARRSRTSSSVV